jgi:hypothetical protein
MSAGIQSVKQLMTTLGLVALSTTAFAAPPAASTSFESDSGGWVVLNPATGQPDGADKIAVVHDAAQIKEGKGSLKYSYAIRKGSANILILPLASTASGPISSFHFWLKPDHSTSFLFAVGAKGGSRYQSVFSAKAGAWQEVSIGLSDLSPADGQKGGPKTPAADQIENVGIVDTNSYLIQMFGGQNAPIDFHEGDHSFLLSPFAAQGTELAPSPKPAVGTYPLITTFRPQLDWMVIGGPAVEKATGSPLMAPGIKATYKQEKAKIVALMKSISADSLTGAKSIRLSAASKNTASIVVQLEEADGGKYKATLDIEGGSKLKDYKIDIAEFTQADDSKDSNNKLDLDQVVRVILVDYTALAGGAEGENILWLADLHSVK